MTTHIVENWTQVPFVGIQIWKFETPQKAFEHAQREYKPYGYNTAYFSKDIKTLFIGRTEQTFNY